MIFFPQYVFPTGVEKVLSVEKKTVESTDIVCYNKNILRKNLKMWKILWKMWKTQRKKDRGEKYGRKSVSEFGKKCFNSAFYAVFGNNFSGKACGKCGKAEWVL